MRRSTWVAIALLVAVVATAASALLVAPPRASRSLRQFDPNRLASLEVGMWKAYYGKARVRLFGLLVTMLHEQYHYSWLTAAREGFHLARAAAIFGDARGDYETQVLPDLEQAYTTARDWLGAGFEPRAVARAELAWWIARRVPGEDSPEHVGALMAQAYGLLYEAPASTLMEAAVFRARAGALRDAQAQQPDWPAIERLLEQSYSSLHAALSGGAARSSSGSPRQP